MNRAIGLSFVAMGLACGLPQEPNSNPGADSGVVAQPMQLTDPPAANALPDGGTTPDGGSAANADRLRTQLGWFADQGLRCTVTLNNGTTTRSYDNVQLRVADGANGFALNWTMTAASVDTYSYTVVFDDNSTVSLNTDSVVLVLDYDGYLLGYYHQFLTFAEPAADAALHRSQFRLTAFSDFSMTNVSCTLK